MRWETTRRAFLGLGLGAVATTWRPFTQARAATMGTTMGTTGQLFYVQPLGRNLPPQDVALVKTALEALIGVTTRLRPAAGLPAAAFYRPRQRYRAEKLLDFLDRCLPSDGARILGLTGVDISTTKGRVADWGLLGLGRLGGASSVVSAFRCRKTARGPTQARERLAKVAVHEIGHTLGLAHCPTRGCLMEDAGGLVATCDREYDLCDGCRRLLADAGWPLPVAPKIPWRRP